jgi:hypothetical protein
MGEDTPVEHLRWEDVGEYVAAGNVMRLRWSEDLCDIKMEILYGNTAITREIVVRCLGVCYFEARRRDDHESGTAALILEASLQTSSPLIDALYAHQLDGLSGSTIRPQSGPVYHLELVGQLHVTVLSAGMAFAMGPEVPDRQTRL